MKVIEFDRFPNSFSQVILFSGPTHRRHSTVITPFLRRNRLTRNFNWMLQCVDRCLVDGWRHADPSVVHMDIIEKAKVVVLHMFTHIAFQLELDMPTEQSLHQALHDISSLVGELSVLPMSLVKIYLFFSPKYRRARKFFHEYSNQILHSAQTDDVEFDDEKKSTTLLMSLTDAVKMGETGDKGTTESTKASKYVVHSTSINYSAKSVF